MPTRKMQAIVYKTPFFKISVNAFYHTNHTKLKNNKPH